MGIDKFDGKPIQACSDWSHKLFLVEACADEEQLLLSWRNEETVRKQSFTSRAITPKEHHKWFHHVLNNPDVKILILYLGKHPVGFIRFECDEVQATMSYTIDCSYRDLGLGSKLICMSVSYAERSLKVPQLCAETKKDNRRSQRVLLSNGFQQISENTKRDSFRFVRAITPPPRGV